MSEMLRFAGAVKRDPAIDAWLSEQSDALGSLARKWFNAMRECGKDVRELMHDGCPVACVDDAPFGYVNVFTNHVNVGFFFGAELDDPEGLMEGSGKRMRHVKLRPGASIDLAVLSTRKFRRPITASIQTRSMVASGTLMPSFQKRSTSLPRAFFAY